MAVCTEPIDLAEPQWWLVADMLKPAGESFAVVTTHRYHTRLITYIV